jgi:hypothetical protein
MMDKHTATSIAALREALISADSEHDGSFAAVFSTFLDITERCGLIAASKPAKDPMIKATLEPPVRALLGDDATVQQLRMLRCAGAGLLHGGFFVGSAIGTFFYFEKDQQGMLALYRGGAMTHFARITLSELPAGTMPVRGPKGKQ